MPFRLKSIFCAPTCMAQAARRHDIRIFFCFI
ncbi:MAG: hypothetical protein IJ199_00345 [Prevotella sp.]|nr:hypothetical protein [Prevotella sp.]